MWNWNFVSVQFSHKSYVPYHYSFSVFIRQLSMHCWLSTTVGRRLSEEPLSDTTFSVEDLEERSVPVHPYHMQ